MKKNNGNKGFTLVELLITVAILALIVAPFLGTFVVSSGNNLNASQKENAAHLAEDLAEEIKAKSLDVLSEEYDNGTGGDAYDDTTGIYTFDIPGSKLPKGIKKGFSAEATLTPSATNPINAPLPTLSNMSGTDTMLFMSAFYANDRYEETTNGATYRDSYIDVTYDAVSDKYHVALTIKYFGSTGLVDTRVMSESDFDDKPSVYAIYTPMSASDHIYFRNRLAEADMEDDDGDVIPVDFYLSVQTDVSLIPVSESSVNISDDIGISADIRNYIMSSNKYTNVYTNLTFSPAISTGYESSLVTTTKKDKLYDLEVVVKYNGNECAKFVSSKLNLG